MRSPDYEMRMAYSHMLDRYGPDFTYGFLRGLTRACEDLMKNIEEARNE